MNAKWLDLDFQVCDPAGLFNEVPGVYIFARPDRWWFALYVGQTESFASRLPYHERWPEAARQGATHIHARIEPDYTRRCDLEARLIQTLAPPMNTQEHLAHRRMWS